MGNLCGGAPPSQGRGADGANIPGAVTFTGYQEKKEEGEMGSKRP